MGLIRATLPFCVCLLSAAALAENSSIAPEMGQNSVAIVVPAGYVSKNHAPPLLHQLLQDYDQLLRDRLNDFNDPTKPSRFKIDKSWDVFRLLLDQEYANIKRLFTEQLHLSDDEADQLIQKYREILSRLKLGISADFSLEPRLRRFGLESQLEDQKKEGATTRGINEGPELFNVHFNLEADPQISISSGRVFFEQDGKKIEIPHPPIELKYARFGQPMLMHDSFDLLKNFSMRDNVPHYFDFYQNWLWSNLGPNYFSFEKTDELVKATLNEDMWRNLVTSLIATDVFQDFRKEFLKDVKAIAKQKFPNLTLLIYQAKGEDVKAVVESKIEREKMETLRAQQKLEMALSLDIPLNIETLDVDFKMEPEQPLRIKTSFQPDKQLKIKVHPLFYDLASKHGPAGKVFSPLITEWDRLSKGLDFEVMVQNGDEPTQMTIPIEWTDYGPWVNPRAIEAMLGILKTAEIKSLELRGEKPVTLLPQASFSNILEHTPEVARNIRNVIGQAKINEVYAKVEEWAQTEIRGLVTNLIDSKLKIPLANEENGFSAALTISDLQIDPEFMSCEFRPESKDFNPFTDSPWNYFLRHRIDAWEKLYVFYSVKCHLKIPKKIGGKLEKIKTEAADISLLNVNLTQGEADSPYLDIDLELAYHSGQDRIYFLPVNTNLRELLGSFKPSVDVPASTVVVAKGFKGGTAEVAEDVSAGVSKLGRVFRQPFVNGAGELGGIEIRRLKRNTVKSVAEAEIKKQQGVIATELYKQLYEGINPTGNALRGFNESWADQVKSLVQRFHGPGEKKDGNPESLYEITDTKLKSAVGNGLNSAVLRSTSEETIFPFFNPFGRSYWHDLAYENILKIPYLVSDDIHKTIMDVVQENVFDPLTKEVNDYVRKFINEEVREKLDFSRAAGSAFSMPSLTEVCLVQAQGTRDFDTIFAMAKSTFATIPPIAEKLPPDFPEEAVKKMLAEKKGDPSLHIVTRLSSINDVLAINKEKLRLALENAIKFETLPNGEKKLRKHIDPKKFNVGELDTRVVFVDSKPQFQFKTKGITQSFRLASRAVPLLGHILDAPFKLFLNLDTDQIEGSVNLDSEFRVAAGEAQPLSRSLVTDKGPMTPVSRNVLNLAREELQKLPLPFPTQFDFGKTLGLRVLSMQAIPGAPEWVSINASLLPKEKVEFPKVLVNFPPAVVKPVGPGVLIAAPLAPH